MTNITPQTIDLLKTMLEYHDNLSAYSILNHIAFIKDRPILQAIL
jgi:hypothetical protein